jgi:uncharacterized membrane protein YhaH (DUF805 family)
MTTASNTQAHLEQLQILTREYAKFSKSAAGWGSITGGILGLLLYAIINRSDLPNWARLLCGLAPIIWLGSKQLVRSRYYQRHGQVLETSSTPVWLERVLQGMIIGVMFCVLGAGLVALAIKPENVLRIPTPNLILAVLLCAFGIYAARLINTTAEMLAALQMFIAAFYILGGLPGNPDSLWALPVYSSLLLVIGIYEHWQYRGIENQLRKLQAGQS